MKLIRERTKCPVPEAVAYDDTLTNDLGAPYIIMKACTGVQAFEVWYDEDKDGDWDYENTDSPSAARLEKCKVFLQSLARAMAELRTLEFDAIGVLSFEDPNIIDNAIIGSSWLWKIDSDTVPEDLGTDAVLQVRPVSNSSPHLFINGLIKTWPLNALEGPNRTQAIHYILDVLFRAEPFASSKNPGDDKETFVLRHDDLNFQNIFCDPETGEVTGIIGWERAFAAPRCIGYSSHQFS
jgi:aminoglycoside phosphotransferase (APT) family kinase protein